MGSLPWLRCSAASLARLLALVFFCASLPDHKPTSNHSRLPPPLSVPHHPFITTTYNYTHTAPTQRLPPLQAASPQLSQAELDELLAENAKLKQMLSTYKDRLSPEQVCVCVFIEGGFMMAE